MGWMKKPKPVEPNSSNFSRDINIIMGILQGSQKSVVELIAGNRTLPCDISHNCDNCLLTWNHPQMGKIHCNKQPLFTELIAMKSKIYIKAIEQMQKTGRSPEDVLTFVRKTVEDKPIPKYMLRFALKYANERWEIYQKAKLIK